MERRKKRDAQLEEKHRLEMEEELTRQQQERDKLKEGIARKVEDQELKKNVKVRLCRYLMEYYISSLIPYPATPQNQIIMDTNRKGARIETKSAWIPIGHDENLIRFGDLALFYKVTAEQKRLNLW